MDTNTITYGERFIISDNPLRRISWQTSKIEATTTWGLTKLTFTQELEYDETDNLTWINLKSNNFSDTKTGSDYDYYKERFNDEEIHNPIDPNVVSKSVISYTGVKPCVKVGGSLKTFTANIYTNGEFSENRPYWRLEYSNHGEDICIVNFIYVNDKLICDNSENDFVIDKNQIVYLDEHDNQIFGIQFEADQKDLGIKCLPILNMIGGEIVISASEDLINYPASLTVEVEGL